MKFASATYLPILAPVVFLAQTATPAEAAKCRFSLAAYGSRGAASLCPTLNDEVVNRNVVYRLPAEGMPRDHFCSLYSFASVEQLYVAIMIEQLLDLIASRAFETRFSLQADSATYIGTKIPLIGTVKVAIDSKKLTADITDTSGCCAKSISVSHYPEVWPSGKSPSTGDTRRAHS